MNGIQGYRAELKNSGYAILSSSEEGISASVWYKESFYSVEPVEDGIYFVSESDINEIGKHDGHNDYSSIKNEFGKTIKSTSVNSTLSAATMKIFVAYTHAVAQNYNVSTLINQFISSTNTAYQFSLVSSGIELAGSTQLTYTESGDDYTDVTRFMTKNDGYMDEIHSLRNQYDADVCVLLVNSLNSNGRVPDIGAERSIAFFVVKANAAVANYSFAHELGHLLGCRHDNDLTNYPYPNARGYNWLGKLPYSPNVRFYRTIMSTEDEQKYLRVQYFSNPYVEDQLGNPMGIYNSNYCAFAIDDYAPYISGFYPYYTSSGTITENEWWKGTVTINGNVVIPAGMSITIIDNTNVNFINQGFITGPGMIFLNTGITLNTVSWDRSLIAGGFPSTANVKLIWGEYPGGLDSYPNPFNPLTRINYSIEQSGFVTIKIYDLLGSEIATLVNEVKEKGMHSASFNASDFPSGVYIYTMKINTFVSSKKWYLQNDVRYS